MDIKPPNNRRTPGVTRRQERHRIGDFENTRAIKQAEIREGRALPDPMDQPAPAPFKLDTSDIDETKESAETKKHWWRWLKPSYLRRNFSPRQFFKKTALVSGTLLLFVVGYFGFKLFFASQNIIDRDSGGALALQGDPSLLNGEGDGRVNIVLIGIGGERHDGGSLADTIIVLSVDPFNNEAALLSIPRDLRVEIPGYGNKKINEAHYAGEELNFSEDGYPDGGPGLMQKTLEQALDIPIHYYVRTDFNGFKQAIDAVGSIQLDIPETVCDYKIAWEYGFSCLEAGVQDLDSNEALFYSRTRSTARSDFDRGERQREVLTALKDKILSTGTLTNPVKVSSLLDAASNNVKTNLQISELMRLQEIAQNIPADKIISAEIVEYIVNAGDGTTDYVPAAGNFSEIRRFVRSIFIDGLIKQEAASIDVLNGTDVGGLAAETADTLRGYGYNVVSVGDTTQKGFNATRLYAVNAADAPVSKRYLEQRFNTTALPGSDLPDGINSSSAFVIIIGNDATR